MSESSTITVELLSMAGPAGQLPPMASNSKIVDLAHAIRTEMGVPISAQNLIWGSTVLKDPAVELNEAFGDVDKVQLLVVRRTISEEEQQELNKRLLRAVAGGYTAQVRELIKEGAGVNLGSPGKSTVKEASAVTAEADLPECFREKLFEHDREEKDEKRNGKKEQEREEEDDRSSASSGEATDDDEEMSEAEDGPRGGKLCNGLTPLMLALAAQDDVLVADLRNMGAVEPDMVPKTQSLGEALGQRDFVDAVRHLAAGADPNMQLRRGEGIQDTSEGHPLHACCAMHRIPGSHEVAQVLIRKGADTNLGDKEGDTPLAHARYFRAPREFYTMLQGCGAEIRGPFYTRFGQIR